MGIVTPTLVAFGAANGAPSVPLGVTPACELPQAVRMVKAKTAAIRAAELPSDNNKIFPSDCAR